MDDTGFEFGVTPFYFLRHGETFESEEGILQGQSETELTPLGRRTAERAAESLSKVHLGSIYASPLKRTMMTAKIVGMFNGAPVFPCPGLAERQWGHYEGKPKDRRPPLASPRGTESMEDFEQRILDAMISIPGPSPVLMVAHSGVFRIICGFAGLPTDSSVSVASGQVLKLKPRKRTDRPWRIKAI